jgi:hypothetical protein
MQITTASLAMIITSIVNPSLYASSLICAMVLIDSRANGMNTIDL